MTILNGIGHVASLRPAVSQDAFRMLARTPLASGINENITLNMQYLHSTAENRA
jgi:hypothetical protein